MKKWLIIITAVLALLGMTACGKKQNTVKPTTIKITTDPVGAQIRISGKNYGKSPLNGKFSSGVYVISAEKPGFAPVWKSVKVEKGKNNEVNFSLSPLKSSVLLTTVPNIKANVTYKGKVIGQTPIVLSDLEYGKHNADLKAPGYSPAHIEWNIDSSRPQRIAVRITENTGVIRIERANANGAMVKINGRNHGSLPSEFRMEQGEYQVEVTAPGYTPYVQKVSLASGRKVSVRPRLTELPGKIIVNSKPAGAMVTMNGKRYGTTPITLEGIKSGRVRLVLSKHQYDPVTVDLGVGPGKTVKVSRNLTTSLGTIEFVTVPAGVTVYLDNKLLTVTEKDPRSKGYSKVIRTGPLRPGEHVLKFAHKRAKPKEKTVTVTVQKNKNHRIPGVVELWVPNAQITLKVGSKYEGRIVRQSEKSITFEQSRKSRLDYNRDELEKIEWLSEEE